MRLHSFRGGGVRVSFFFRACFHLNKKKVACRHCALRRASGRPLAMFDVILLICQAPNRLILEGCRAKGTKAALGVGHAKGRTRRRLVDFCRLLPQEKAPPPMRKKKGKIIIAKRPKKIFWQLFVLPLRAARARRQPPSLKKEGFEKIGGKEKKPLQSTGGTRHVSVDANGR